MPTFLPGKDTTTINNYCTSYESYYAGGANKQTNKNPAKAGFEAGFFCMESSALTADPLAKGAIICHLRVNNFASTF